MTKKTISIRDEENTMLRGRLEERLSALKSEYESGQKVLADLQVKQSSLHETLLRISGAIQVLEEELAQQNKNRGNTETEQQADGQHPPYVVGGSS